MSFIYRINNCAPPYSHNDLFETQISFCAVYLDKSEKKILSKKNYLKIQCSKHWVQVSFHNLTLMEP